MFDLTILKNQIFLIKKPFNFLTIERYDIELTNTKISDKNIVPLGGAQGPSREIIFTVILKFHTQFGIVYGSQHHSVTRKIGFRKIF